MDGTRCHTGRVLVCSTYVNLTSRCSSERHARANGFGRQELDPCIHALADTLNPQALRSIAKLSFVSTSFPPCCITVHERGWPGLLAGSPAPCRQHPQRPAAQLALLAEARAHQQGSSVNERIIFAVVVDKAWCRPGRMRPRGKRRRSRLESKPLQVRKIVDTSCPAFRVKCGQSTGVANTRRRIAPARCRAAGLCRLPLQLRRHLAGCMDNLAKSPVLLMFKDLT
jgi:hypothetical protein